MKKYSLVKYPTKKPEKHPLASTLLTAVCERPEPKRKLEQYLRKMLLQAYGGRTR